MKIQQSLSIGLAAFLTLAVAPFASANIPEIPEIPDLANIISEFRVAQEALVQERRELAEALRGQTTEDRQAAIAEYQEANEDRIALHRALGEQIRDLMKEGLPEIPAGPQILSAEDIQPERPEISAPIQDLIETFRATRDGLIQERLTLLALMKDATDEQRAEALAALRARNEEIMAGQKAMAQEIRVAVQDIREDRRNND